MIFTPEVRFGPKPTKTHLFLPSGRKNAPKRTVLAQKFLRFFKCIFHLAALKKPARKCFGVPKDAKLRARRPRVGILELPRGISTVRANTSYRHPISKIFFNAQLGQKFWHEVDERKISCVLRGFGCSGNFWSRENWIWRFFWIFWLLPFSLLICGDIGNLRPLLL